VIPSSVIVDAISAPEESGPQCLLGFQNWDAIASGELVDSDAHQKV